MLKNNLIWSEGRSILITLLLFTGVGGYLYIPLGVVGVLVVLYVGYFFRNPERYPNSSVDLQAAILSPADGTIVFVGLVPAYEDAPAGYKISIFMSLGDVHINRIPIAGTVVRMRHRPGKFYPAYIEKSSRYNEAHDIDIVTRAGSVVTVRQIAGMLARRTVCWATVGQEFSIGERFGMIKFSSRVDLFLPESATVQVMLGQQVYAGVTVLGSL